MEDVLITMVDLWLTSYGNFPSPLNDPAFLLNEFMFKRNVEVRVSQMPFEEAWTKILQYALYGNGPHISLIGSIWVSTLKPINVLRAFSRTEIFEMGGARAYCPGAWDYAMSPMPAAHEVPAAHPVPAEHEVPAELDVQPTLPLPPSQEGPAAWSIPFEIYTHLVLYRKDLLARASIDEANAFSSAGAMIDTVQRLQAAGIPSPLILPTGTFPARPHFIASWIWGAGGEFVSQDGAQPLFTEAEAMRGMRDFFSLYRLMSPADRGMNVGQATHQFAYGNAAVIITGSNAQRDLLRANVPEVMENLGVAPLPGVPWIGGTNLVLWKEVCMNPEQERAAVDLAKFLNTPAAQNKISAANYLAPARFDAMAEHPFPVEDFRAAMEYTMQFGRAYPTVEMWMRIVNELRSAFDLVTEDVLERPEDGIEAILRARLMPLAQRLRLMLG